MKVFLTFLIFFVVTIINNCFAKKTQLELFFENKEFMSLTDSQRMQQLKKIHFKLLRNRNLDGYNNKVELYCLDKLFFDLQPHNIIKTKFIINFLEKNKEMDVYLRNLLKSHLARNLYPISLTRASKTNDEVLSFALENHHKNMLISSQEMKAGILYNEKKYSRAVTYYMKAIQQLKKPSIYKASMANNLSLCFLKIKKFKQALIFNKKAIKILLQTNKSTESKYFKELLHANQGEICFHLKLYANAKNKLESYFKFVLQNPSRNEYASKKLWILYKIYIQEKNTKGKKSITVFNENILKYETDLTKKMNAAEYLTLIYTKEKDIANLSRTNSLYKSFRDAVEANFKLNLSLVNDEMVSYSIYNILNKEKVAKELKEKKSMLLVLIVTSSLVIFILIIFSRYKSNKKQLEINLLQQEKLHQSMAFKESTINQLQLNLELKNSMNKIFVDNIKSLRKKKNIPTETILKELQIQVSNLIQIDKKNVNIIESKDSEKKRFLEILKEYHPDLTKMQLELCSYLRLELNSKEIASLMNNTDGTVRVNKTKLKEKLGLPKDQTIEAYLKQLIENNAREGLVG